MTDSDYSNLRLRDAISTVNGLIDRAIELGHSVIAFTEHETVSNAIKIEKYYNEIKKTHPDFKVIMGNEIYLVRNGLTAENFDKDNDYYYHFILLAKDAEGHKQIRELSTRAWMRSYKNGKMRRVPTYYKDLEEIVGKNRGHVIGSTACLGSCISRMILKHKENEDPMLWSAIIKKCQYFKELFGEGNFYFELQPSPQQEQKYANEKLIKIGEELGIPCIITNDVHYLRKEDAKIHKAFLRAQEGDREVDAFYSATYLMPDDEVRELLNYVSDEKINEMYNNILKIKDMCEDYSLQKPLKIPSLKWKEPSVLTIDKYVNEIPYLQTFYDSSFDGDRRLAQIIVSKLDSNKELCYRESFDEINSNLEMIWISSEVNKAHWSAYLLNLQNIIDNIWESGSLVGAGRGSGGGFYLLYILDIIQVNKLKETTELYPWRFLNPSRVSVLDIDIDTSGLRRDQVLRQLRKEYGEDRVANVATFGLEKSKSAILTGARGLGIDVDIAQYIASIVPADRGILRTLHQCYYGDPDNDFKPIPEFVKQMNDYPELWEVAQKIEGLVCRMGCHAGGVIFVDEPFVESTALMRTPDGTIITQFDLHDCEDVSRLIG